MEVTPPLAPSVAAHSSTHIYSTTRERHIKTQLKDHTHLAWGFHPLVLGASAAVCSPFAEIGQALLGLGKEARSDQPGSHHHPSSPFATLAMDSNDIAGILLHPFMDILTEVHQISEGSETRTGSSKGEREAIHVNFGTLWSSMSTL